MSSLRWVGEMDKLQEVELYKMYGSESAVPVDKL